MKTILAAGLVLVAQLGSSVQTLTFERDGGGSPEQAKQSAAGDFNLPPPCQSTNKDSWHFVDANNSVRVWYRAGNQADSKTASTLAQEIDVMIWPEITKVLTDTLPHSDIEMGCNGGDGRLDIYIADVKEPITIPFEGCQNVPVFIKLQPGNDRSLVAHEIFHAFQYSYPLKDCILFTDYYWWAEASAQWAMERVYPRDQSEWKTAPELLHFPDTKSLDLHEKAHAYGAYLLPFFVSHQTGSADFVRVAWNLCKDKPALEALNDALSGGFKDVWPEFVLRNWNAPPIQDYKTWDLLTYGAVRDTLAVTTAVLPDAALSLHYNLPHLTAKYFHFTFGPPPASADDTTSTVAFWNGAKSKLSLSPLSVGGIGYSWGPASAAETKGITVRALIKMEFQDWKIETWTDRPYVAYCRDMRDERIKELILIFSNSEFEDRTRKLTPPGLAPVLWVSNMGCWQWEGNATHTDTTTGERITAQATWTRSVPSQTVPVISYEPEGSERWSFSGDCSGNGTLPIQKGIAGAPLATLATYNFTPPSGSHQRSYVGTGNETRSVDVNCIGVPKPTPVSLGGWFQTPDQPLFPGNPDARFVQVDRSGKVMDGSYTTTFSGEIWTWHFVAKRQ